MKNILKVSAVLFLVGLVLSFLPAKVKKLQADKTKSYIKYFMYHPAHDWEGISKAVTCNIMYNDSSKAITGVGVSVAIAGFDSQNANRDSHTLEATEALKYPNVKFASTSVVNNDTTLNVKGQLTFHNITKAVSFVAKKKFVGNEMIVNGGFSIKLTDYGIEPPTLMMAAAEDLVKLEFYTVFKVN